ncbi:MAG: DUF1559 domain-containing protein [Planctomycetota bacterium]|nr:MAG: DUF1559 domain-containing protein [Planctomycetota bacterium]REJ95664.1 MAG: DUF1559 domain-containing protein [Planctomycetota bacterium]REK29175.1 MAG: DUF1559 domain-containing protein [Planctomycetota bacterium]REK46965.1 MAG: DUF1559 domain-containing protein [Planctomycetota bacterium]
MPRTKRSAFTLIELLIVLAVIGILLALLTPAVQKVLENARQITCRKNMAELGKALLMAKNQMTSSMYFINDTNPDNIRLRDSAAQIAQDLDLGSLQPGQQGIGEQATPYSFLVRLMPYLGMETQFQDLDKDDGPFDVGDNDPNNQWGGNIGIGSQVIQALLCPSVGQEVTVAVDVYTNQPVPALTQYKALGASTLDALLSRQECVRSEGQGGAIHPWAKGSVENLRAPSQTAVMCETKEERFAAWIDGVYAAIPGIIPDPDGGSGNTNGVVGINRGQVDINDTNEVPFLGANSLVNDGSGGNTSATSTRLGTQDLQWGPSSNHPTIVHHLFGDGSVQVIAEDIEVLAYRALISRQGRDNRFIQNIEFGK